MAESSENEKSEIDAYLEACQKAVMSGEEYESDVYNAASFNKFKRRNLLKSVVDKHLENDDDNSSYYGGGGGGGGVEGSYHQRLIEDRPRPKLKRKLTWKDFVTAHKKRGPKLLSMVLPKNKRLSRQASSRTESDVDSNGRNNDVNGSITAVDESKEAVTIEMDGSQQIGNQDNIMNGSILTEDGEPLSMLDLMTWQEIVDLLVAEGDFRSATIFDSNGDIIAATEDSLIDENDASGVFKTMDVNNRTICGLFISDTKFSCLAMDQNSMVGRTSENDVFVAHRSNNYLICVVSRKQNYSCLGYLKDFMTRLTEPMEDQTDTLASTVKELESPIEANEVMA